jgi:predicted DNA-binding transcriptional regulator AlpA
VIADSGILQALNKEFDRAFEVRISEGDGKLRIQYIEVDAGQEFMTLGDVAALLQMERTAIRRMTEARAQQNNPDPLPFIAIGKSLRFKRTEIFAWLDRRQAVSAILPPAKGKVKSLAAIPRKGRKG